MKRLKTPLKLASLGLLFWSTSLAHHATAQINVTPDGSTQTFVNFNAASGRWEITGNTRSLSGTVLLHSLIDFSIGAADTVTFIDGNPNLQTVITRVTGNAQSNILGALQTQGDFDLFLINPNGIIFGPNARVDIRGSFIATTAESVVFNNGEIFSSSSLTTPSLTINLPVSLRFGNTTNPIQVNGAHTVPSPFPRISARPANPNSSGYTLALIGGELNINNGNVSATNGRVALGSVTPQSRVNLNPITAGWLFDYNDAQGFGDITLDQSARVSATGGDMQIEAENLLIEGNSIIDLSPSLTQAAGNLVITASDSVQLSGASTRIFSENGGSTQNVGNFSIRTERLRLDSGTTIRSTTSGAGLGGDINVYANTIELVNGDLLTESRVTATNDAGNINLFTQNLTMQAGASISASTQSLGLGGNITVRPLQPSLPSSVTISDLSFITAEDFTTSQGGNISLENIGRLTLNTGGEITTQAVNGQGGTIDIQVGDQISLSDNSRITSEATVNGNAGGVSVRSGGSLELQDFSRITVESVNGQGGALDVNANSISLRNNSRITSEATGAGSAGDITLTSEVVTLFDRSSITAATQSLTGGNITFRNQALIFMGPCEQGSCPTGNNAITASAAGTANGGNIAMIFRPEGGLLYSPLPLRPTNNDVIASAVSGNGGTITIQNLIALDPRRRNPVTGQPDPLHFVQFSGVATPDSDLIASSAFGVDGNVELNFRQDLESDDLPSEFLGNELEQSCTTGGRAAPEQERSRSTFTITGQGGTAPGLDTPLSGSRIRVDPAPLPNSDSDTSAPSGDRDRPLPSATARSLLPATPCQTLDS
jgi:filamentous hemagglutinin family protein